MVSCVAIRNEKRAPALSINRSPTPEMDSCVSIQPGSGTRLPTRSALTLANRELITLWIAVDVVPARSTLHPLKLKAKHARIKIDNLLRNMKGAPLYFVGTILVIHSPRSVYLTCSSPSIRPSSICAKMLFRKPCALLLMTVTN